ncbi:hypothetical protein RFM68_08185 [Mesorhizobium sp. MSK_1335]|uniref:Sulfotransferase domain-containing protein n=1 Tax=Mesorhizobium montanum TaxID=3072323 RepID=A0ABU4ZHE9_9HYPH|nr:hypothetical protein [Mesorhizobium sp. MSK_1335]MDX8524482.1 hypothetical protein [Mesorhizobium sp. MSK_1335]
MLVFVSGMPRSGSTYSYNVIKQALSRRGGVASVLSDRRAQFTSGQTAHAIYKAHDADDELIAFVRNGSVKSVCTIRKPENAVLSWLTMFDGEPAQVIDAVMLPWLRLYERIAAHSLVVSMDEIEGRRLRSTWKIGRYVCPDYSPIEWAKDCRDLSKRRISDLLKDVEDRKRKIVDGGWTYYDEETFFHRRHISDRSKFDTRPEVLADIRNRLAPWLDQNGNLIRLERKTL